MSPSLKQSTPIFPSPIRLRGMGSLHLKGAGEVLLELDGSGQVAFEVRGDLSVQYAGEPAQRVARPGQAVWLGARGALTLRGSDVEVRFSGGTVRATALGRFLATVDGHGEIESRSGRAGWGLHPRTLRLEAGQAADVASLPSSGAAA